MNHLSRLLTNSYSSWTTSLCGISMLNCLSAFINTPSAACISSRQATSDPLSSFRWSIYLLRSGLEPNDCFAGCVNLPMAVVGNVIGVWFIRRKNLNVKRTVFTVLASLVGTVAFVILLLFCGCEDDAVIADSGAKFAEWVKQRFTIILLILIMVLQSWLMFRRVTREHGVTGTCGAIKQLLSCRPRL